MALTYHDVDLFGNEKSDGTAIEHFDDEAIKSALMLWITSKKGDFLYQLELGGVLDRAIFKSMNSDVSALITFTIKNALTNYFSPTINIVNISVVPDYKKRIWEINISYNSKLSIKTEQLQIYTKDILGIVQQMNTDVDYVGENLKMFVLMQKVNMGNNLITYDEDDGVFKWGKFTLTEFTTEDVLYDEIIALANS